MPAYGVHIRQFSPFTCNTNNIHTIVNNMLDIIDISRVNATLSDCEVYCCHVNVEGDWPNNRKKGREKNQSPIRLSAPGSVGYFARINN